MKQTELTVIYSCAEEGPKLGDLVLESFQGFLFRELEKFASIPYHDV